MGEKFILRDAKRRVRISGGAAMILLSGADSAVSPEMLTPRCARRSMDCWEVE